MPSLNGPPALNETQRAMESAMKRERARAKEMEQTELNMSADELKAVLKKERSRMAKLSADLAAHKSAAVQSQAEAEVLEEGRINGLVRRLETLQKEKGRIIIELEQEEEMVRILGFVTWYIICCSFVLQIYANMIRVSQSLPTLFKRNWIKFGLKRRSWSNK